MLTGLRLLLVDDDQDTRTLFAFILEDYGAKVFAVSSVQAAIEAIEQHTPHLLISDINLPDEDGYSLITRIRKLKGESAKLPAIAITGFVRDHNSTDVLSAGFQHYLCKPVVPDELITAVMRYVHLREA